MKIFLLVAFAALACRAEELASLEKPSTSWKFSVGFMVGGSALDAASSFGRVELDPILGRGNYGARQVGFQAGAMVALPLIERWTIRRWPRSQRTWTYVNYAIGGAHIGAAVHNRSQQ